ncbi:hypothetical protein NPIL_26011 [Nephila pilipes]|uniref:Uncharacterized protein n=1 Tax=Nephila pilipes TaxID=299642 RepID=A0A8X6ULC5_NEPPI|nr:hypothetical protein NPIL_26011 [Nephila pilipes]
MWNLEFGNCSITRMILCPVIEYRFVIWPVIIHATALSADCVLLTTNYREARKEAFLHPVQFPSEATRYRFGEIDSAGNQHGVIERDSADLTVKGVFSCEVFQLV